MGLPEPPILGTAMLPIDTYRNQVVMITGGGTGLGKAMALEFARLGAAVAVTSRKAANVAEGVRAIEAVGARALGVEADVRDPAQIAAAFDTITAALGPVDVLVNNAAGNFPVAAEDLSYGGWRAVTAIVLDGTFICSTELARRAIAAERGAVILNIGATYSWTGGPGTAHSAAAKAGVTNLTESLAVEWAPLGIRVNCLAPGLFPHDNHSPELKAVRPTGGVSEADTIPAGRTGRPHELGWAATYMCSPYAAYLTGHTMVLDGANWLRRGLRMPPFVPVREQLQGTLRPVD
ncbi:MAG: oxidoreductase [Acidimicrobiia bacterium]|nr:oxidoreductase [Acidimicrobiia bacterium]